MVVRCSGCQTAYRLGPGRLPVGGVRVRCPGCGHVFRVRVATTRPPSTPSWTESTPAPPRSPSGGPSDLLPGLERDERTPPSLALRPQPAPPTAPPTQWVPDQERTIDFDAQERASVPPPRLETPPFRPSGTDEATPAPTSAPPALQPSPGPDDAVTERVHARARRLARVLVSDILVYNQEDRDRALGRGNLASALGAEVNKAWELYKSRVDPDVLQTTSFFKDALNEILADGQKVF